MTDTTQGSGPLTETDTRIDFFHRALSEWILDPTVTIACGVWEDGAIAELMPEGRATLLPGIYSGEFSGIRELRLTDGLHHLHLDLKQVDSLCFTVAPTVCLGFKPSLEVRLLTRDTQAQAHPRACVSLMCGAVYEADGSLNQATATRFFANARRLLQERPDCVTLDIKPQVREGRFGRDLLQSIHAACEPSSEAFDWPAALQAMGSTAGTITRQRPPEQRPEPKVVPLLQEALMLHEASLVIYRDRTLIEFKTDRLDGLHRHEEGGYVSWQIGAFDDHHCHLTLNDVTAVEFSAEPVSCQGNRLNYTVWFLVNGPCGNPYREGGLFSITLNAPYQDGVPRLDVINPVFELYRRYADESWVKADTTFLRSMASGPTGERYASGCG